MNTLHIIRTELINRGLPIEQIHLIDVVIAAVIDGLVARVNEQGAELAKLKRQVHNMKTKGDAE